MTVATLPVRTRRRTDPEWVAVKSRPSAARKVPSRRPIQHPIIPLSWCYETFPVPMGRIWRINLYHAVSVLDPGVVVSLIDDLGSNIPVCFELSQTEPDGVIITTRCGLPARGTIGVAYRPARAREFRD